MQPPASCRSNSRQTALIRFPRTTVGGERVEVAYAGPQGGFSGLDQVNLKLPRSLAGRGEVQIALAVAGWVANVVTLSVR